MGRMFYAQPHHPINDRLIHILSTELGSVVIAMRPPEEGERGYYVGLDLTVVDAVREMLRDWQPSEDPGWLEVAPDERARRVRPGPLDATFAITILAAYELDEHQRDTDRHQEVCLGERRTRLEIHTTPEGAARIASLREVAGIKVEQVIPVVTERSLLDEDSNHAHAHVDVVGGDFVYVIDNVEDGPTALRVLADDARDIRKDDRVAIAWFDGEDHAHLLEVLP